MLTPEESKEMTDLLMNINVEDRAQARRDRKRIDALTRKLYGVDPK